MNENIPTEGIEVEHMTESEVILSGDEELMSAEKAAELIAEERAVREAKGEASAVISDEEQKNTLTLEGEPPVENGVVAYSTYVQQQFENNNEKDV